MVRKKTHSRITNGSLITFALLLTTLSWGGPFKIGEITQVEGESTYYNYLPPRAVKTVKRNAQAATDGSYLTQENAFLTFKLLGSNYLRLNPKSKISLEYDAKEKFLTIHLFSGSFKALFTEKVLVKSADTLFETVNAKFSVVRNTLGDNNSVYVEKGSVIMSQYVGSEKKDMEVIHAKESTSVADNSSDIEAPKKLTDKEIQFLHPSFYLNGKK